MKFIYCLILIYPLNMGCDRNNFSVKLQNKIEVECKRNPCSIDISTVTSFKWDKMYVFKNVATLPEIRQILDTTPETNFEFSSKIVFTSSKRIVFFEENEVAIEQLENGEVVFDMPDTVNYRVYSITNPIFMVMKKEFSDGVYYELKQ